MSNLGKSKRHRIHRHKASTAEFTNQGPVRLEQAYSELSRAAFGYWLRILGEDSALVDGRTALSKVTGYSIRRSNELLKELERKGYVGFFTKIGGDSASVVIHRRCILDGRSGFLRLSDVIVDSRITKRIEFKIGVPKCLEI